MRAWRNAWSTIAVIVLAGMFNFFLVEQAKAFTQIESQFLPAVQLVASQSAQVSVVNFSTASVEITVDIFNGAGSDVITKTVTVGAGKTFGIRFQNGKTQSTYSALVSASAASSVISDFQVLATNGETVAVSPALLELPAVQHTGSARLLPGQAAAVAITNVSTLPATFTVQVFDNVGNVVLTQQGSINADQTLSFQFTNTAKANVGYHAVISTSAANTLTPNLITFDVASGRLISIVPPGPCKIGS